MSTGYELTKAHLPIERMADLEAVGNAIAQSGMFGVRNAASGLVVAATCHQQGITLMEFQRTYHIVEGRPSMRADAMLAEFRKLGGKVQITENSVTRAAAVFSFEGQKYDWEYTIDDAKRTGDALKGDGTVKQMWQKRPDDMLWARLVSRSIRKLAPEICSGLYTPEEVADFDDQKPGRNREPQPIDIDDAISRAKVVEPVDWSRCPDGFGEYSGMRWEDMPESILQSAAASAILPDDYKSEIRAILAQRQGGEA